MPMVGDPLSIGVGWRVGACIIDGVVPRVGAFIAHGGRSPVDWGGLTGGGSPGVGGEGGIGMQGAKSRGN